MVFVSRELSALFLKRGSPLTENPLLIPIFLAIFILMTATPWDLCYKIVTFPAINNCVGLLAGFNQIRYFTLILRLAKVGSYWERVQIAGGLAVLDQVIEMCLRWLFGANETAMSNSGSLLFTIFLFGGYLVATRRVFDMKYVGTANPHSAALTIGLILSVKLASALMSERESRQRPPESPPAPEEKVHEE
jgi:hypothetical protein